MEFREGPFAKADPEGGVDCPWVGALRFGTACPILGCEEELPIGGPTPETGPLAMALGDGE